YLLATVGEVGRYVALSPLITKTNAATQALLVPVAEAAIVVRPAERQADRRVEEVGFLERGKVALHLGARGCLESESLPATAPGGAIDHILPTGGGAPPVEVLFVEQNLAD